MKEFLVPVKDVEFNVTSMSLFNQLNPNLIFAVARHGGEVVLSIFLWDAHGIHDVFGPNRFDEYFDLNGRRAFDSFDVDGENISLVIEDVQHAVKPEVAITLLVRDKIFTMSHSRFFLESIIIPKKKTFDEISEEVEKESNRVSQMMRDERDDNYDPNNPGENEDLLN